MALAQLSFYLEKFSKFVPPEKVVREAVQKVIAEMFSYTIDFESIVIKKDRVFVSVHPVLKSEMSQKKHEILSRVQSILVKEGVVKTIV